ncbi:hypothetical protein HIJ39_23080 [Sulfobacillus sp. DSM 109850]|uniref:histidine kinase n=1 Tax=Sulfobacillus harzensis TaxID=2729629 RepID=A0A7Y0LB42_9FIRM|nr:hypothetical protein [Sulfobacillus harzensis]
MRNPMQGVTSILDLIQHRLEGSVPLPDQRYLLDMLGLEIRRLSTLLDEVIESYRLDAPNFRVTKRAINLKEVVTRALAPYREG